MTDTGGGWASPGGEPSDWQAPSYPPAYPQPVPQASPAAQPQPAPGGWQGWAPAWTPMPGVVPLRPLGVGELLDGGVKIIRRYPRPTLALSAMIALVVTVIDVLFVALVTSSRTISVNGNESTFGGSFDSGLAGSPSTVLNILGGAVLTGAIVAVVSRAVLGQSVDLGEAWRTIRPRVWALLGVSLLRLLAMIAPWVVVLLAFFLSPVLGVLLGLATLPLFLWVWAVLSLAPAALVLERVKVIAALRRSRVLSSRGFWRVFGILLLSYVITSFLASILLIPIVLIAELPLFTDGSVTLGVGFAVVTAIASGVIQALVSPYTASVRALLYVDQRMRTEGLDVALQAAAATPAPAT
jgi:hypothetical protein